MSTSRYNRVEWVKLASLLLFFVAVFTAAPVWAEDSIDDAQVVWDKPYAGFAVGYSYGKANPTVHTRGAAYFNATDIAQLDPLGSRDLETGNISGTLFGGINHQIGNIVLGLEADFTLSHFDEKYDTGDTPYDSLPGRNFRLQSRVRSDWMASIRPRLGYAFDKSQVYISAGPALSQFKYAFKFNDGFPDSTEINKSVVKLGWTAGVGYEHDLSNGWGLKVDYLHYSFKDIVDSDSSLNAHPKDGFKHDLDYQADTFRFGVFKTF